MGKNTGIVKLVLRLLVPPVILGSMFIVAAFIYISGYSANTNAFDSSIVSGVFRPDFANLSFVPIKKTVINENLNNHILSDHIIHLKNAKAKFADNDKKRAKRFDNDNMPLGNEESEVKDEDKNTKEIEAIINNQGGGEVENNPDMGGMINNQYANNIQTQPDSGQIQQVQSGYANNPQQDYVINNQFSNQVLTTIPVMNDIPATLTQVEAGESEEIKPSVNDYYNHIYTFPEKQSAEEQMYQKFLMQGKELRDFAPKSDKDYNLEREKQINENIARQRIEDFFNKNFVKNYMRLHEVAAGTTETYEMETSESIRIPELSSPVTESSHPEFTVMNLDETSATIAHVENQTQTEPILITNSTNINPPVFTQLDQTTVTQSLAVSQTIETTSMDNIITEEQKKEIDEFMLHFIRKHTVSTTTTSTTTTSSTTTSIPDFTEDLITGKPSIVIYTDENEETETPTKANEKPVTEPMTTAQEEDPFNRNGLNYNEKIQNEILGTDTNVDRDKSTEDDSVEVVTFEAQTTNDENNDKEQNTIVQETDHTENVITYSTNNVEDVREYNNNNNKYDDPRDTKSRTVRGNEDFYDNELPSRGLDKMAENEVESIHVDQWKPVANIFETKKNQTDVLDIIAPWIAIVFTKDKPSDQFTYACDGALISARKILIAANCLKNSTTITEDDDIIIILGKRHQNNMTASDVYTVKQVKYHPRYSIKAGRKIKNNLALVVTDKAIKLDDSRIEVANLLDKQHRDENIVDAVSTGWIETGALHPIHFDVINPNSDCLKKYEKKLSNVFCSTHEPNAPTCPSHGGLYIVQLQDSSWYLKGILSEITSKLNVCGDKNLRFTDITKYDKWLKSNIK